MDKNKIENENGIELPPEKKKKNRGVLIILALIALACLCFAFFNKQDVVTPDSTNNKWDISTGDNVGDITKEDASKIQEELNKKVADSSINISMNTNPVFASGDSEGNLEITNEPVNNYMQIIEIYRDDTEELIYTSSAIPVGKKIGMDKLDVALAKGDYKCTAYFNAITDDGEFVGKAASKITITIQ